MDDFSHLLSDDWNTFTCYTCKRRLEITQMRRITKATVVLTAKGPQWRMLPPTCLDCINARQGSAN